MICLTDHSVALSDKSKVLNSNLQQVRPSPSYIEKAYSTTRVLSWIVDVLCDWIEQMEILKFSLKLKRCIRVN